VRFYQPGRKKKGGVRFLIAPRLDYRARLAVITTCLVFGLAIQVLASVWVGWLPVLAGALLGVSRGLRNKPRFRGKRRWEQVTMEEFQQVLDMAKRSRRWARGPFNLASGRGALTFLGSAYVVLLVGAALGGPGQFKPYGPLIMVANLMESKATPAQWMWLLNAGALAIPIWLSGFRTAWKPEELLLKVRCLQEAAQCIEGRYQTGLTIVPQMEVSSRKPAASRKKKRGLPKPEEERQLPRDARLQVRFDEAPEARPLPTGPPGARSQPGSESPAIGQDRRSLEEFLGLQIQLSINRVGRAYPYLYCVLLARQGFGLRQRLGAVSRVGKEVVEYSTEDDVEVVVYRQYTTRQKGYHTNYRARLRIVTGALKLAYQALGAAEPEDVPAPSSATSATATDRSAGRTPRRR